MYKNLPLGELQKPGIEDFFSKFPHAQLRRYVLPTMDLTRAVSSHLIYVFYSDTCIF